jgi:hypothetical protein
VNDYVVRAFFPKLIPEHSLVIQQDYLLHHWNGWIHVTMEVFSEYFEIVGDTGINSVAFRYRSPAPPEAFKSNVIHGLRQSQIRDLARRAIARFKPKQQEILLKSQEQFQQLMVESRWPE